MGLIYAITKRLPLRTWRGARPTSLEELVEKSEILSDYKIEVQNVRIVPSVVGAPITDGASIVEQSPYGIDVLIKYSNGKELHVWEPSPLPNGGPRMETPEEQLTEDVKYLQAILHERFFNRPVIVYGPNGHSNGSASGEPERGPP